MIKEKIIVDYGKHGKSIIEDIFDYRGFKCMVILHSSEVYNKLNNKNELFSPKWRCGYVGVKKGHLLYGKDIDEIDTLINIHGGLTFSGNFGKKKMAKVIKDILKKDIWWLGFDCNHFEDGIIKWNFENVKKEVIRLSKQLTTKNLILKGLEDDR